jgi:hypothetical protein
MVALVTNHASLGHEEISAPFLIGDIKLLGPSDCENSWKLSYRLDSDQTIPLILTVYQRAADDDEDDDDRDLLYALICAPRFDYANQQDGPKVHMWMDAPLSKMRVPVADMPEDRADWPDFLLSKMAKLQDTDEITLRMGSIDDLKALLQDASDLIRRQIEVHCAVSDDWEPAVFIKNVQPILRHTISAMASYFHPVAAQAPSYIRWLEQREGRIFGQFHPRDLSPRERMEASSRLRVFLEINAAALKIGKRALPNRLKALGVLSLVEKAAAE